MARRLVAKGHEVHMITSWRENDGRSGWFQTKEGGIRVHWLAVPYSNYMSFKQRIFAFLKFAFGAARKAVSIRGDLIFATSTPLTIALPGIYAAKRQRIPMVFEVRDLWPEVPIAIGALKAPFSIAAARWLEKFAYRNADRVVALAPGMRDTICQTGYDIKRTAIIPNGADIGDFQVSGDMSLQGSYSWLREGRIIVYIGTIGPANGVDYIPRLAAELRKQSINNDIRFAVIGDGRCLEEVKKLSVDLGVINKNVFFVGKVAKKHVPEWLNASSATIMTYDGPEVLYRDSVSNKFFDSLAASRPVIANFRGFSTIIAESYGAGMIIPRSDFRSAAVLVNQVLHDDTWLRAGQEKALMLANEYFNRQCLADDLDTVLEDVFINKYFNEGICIGEKYAELWVRSRGNDSITC